jgi:hypothetical protein
MPPTGRILALGVYLVDQANWAEAISAELAASRAWFVEQRWVAAGRSEIPAALRAVTAFRATRPAPKFELLNRLLADAAPDAYDHVLVSDDDIALPRGFVDRYLGLVERYDLALAQPARTHDSFIDHRFVEQLDGLDARRTRFVEIGPLFSVRRDALPLLAPFDLASPMGWGYDFAWPVVMEEAGLAMGVVDATPVAHTLRPPVVNYDVGEADRAMRAYLATHPHLDREEAFRILEAFPGEPS